MGHYTQQIVMENEFRKLYVYILLSVILSLNIKKAKTIHPFRHIPKHIKMLNNKTVRKHIKLTETSQCVFCRHK